MALLKRKKISTAKSAAKTTDCTHLRALLISDSAQDRRWAARDLIGCTEASTSLLEQLACEQEASVRQVILSSLTQIGDQPAVSGLVQCLRSEDVALRNEAIEAMKHLPEAVAPIMANLLNDPDPDVRIFSVNILESLCHPAVETWLIDVIRDDEHVNVCATAVDLLGEVGSPAALTELDNLKQRFSDEPYIQFTADLAIRRIQGS